MFFKLIFSDIFVQSSVWETGSCKDEYTIVLPLRGADTLTEDQSCKIRRKQTCKWMWLGRPDADWLTRFPVQMPRDSWGFWPLSLHWNSAFSQTLPSGCHHHLYFLGKKTLSPGSRKVLGKTSLFALSWNFNPISLLTPVLPWVSAPVSLPVTSGAVLRFRSQTWGWSRADERRPVEGGGS